MMKTCNVCKANKEDTDFNTRRLASGNYGLTHSCKACIKIDSASRYKGETQEQRQARIDKRNEWRVNNMHVVNGLKKKYRQQAKVRKLATIPHDSHVIAYNKEVATTNKRLERESKRKHDAHVVEWKNNGAIYARWQSMHDMSYVSFMRLKRGVQRAFKDADVNTRGWFVGLGYSIHELKDHIEAQFTCGMSWDNRDEWHIDHIKPLCSFNITSIDSEEFKELFSLYNLRPLWADHNRIKYHTYDKHMKARK